MAYKLTPADRRVRADLIRAQRDERFAAQKRDEELRRIEQQQAAQPAAEPEKKNAFVRGLATGWDVSANVATGAAKGIEGIMDMAAAMTPYTGGAFGLPGIILGQIFKDEIKEFVEKDHVGSAMEKPLDALAEQSYLSEIGKAGEVTRQVASGVGQMLPAVAVTVATGGAGAAPAVTQALSLGTTAVSAAGNATEQAFKEGASYEKGLLYGAASGAVEAGTEKLLGGLGGLYGKGIVKSGLKAGAKSVASTGIKRVAKEALGEAAEEALAEGVNPALKTIYKGKDALKEYSDEEFWAGVGEAALIGGLTSPAYSATVGRVMKTGGVYADANSVLEHIGEQQSDIEGKELSVEQEVQAQKNIKADYELLSKRLARSSEKTRANVLKNPQLAAAFESDGTLKADFVAQLDSNIKAAGDTSSGLDRRYYSATARGREAEIVEGLAAQGTKVYAGELSAEESTAYKKAKQIHSKLKSMGFVNTDLVLSETMPDANAYLDGNTVVIGKDTLADGSYVKHLVHETTHFAEGTQEWLDVMDHVFGKDAKRVETLMERVKTSGYGVTQADVDAVVKAVQDGKLKDSKLTKAQQTLVTEVVAMQMEETFGSEDAINRLVGEKPSLAKRIFERIKTFLQTFGKSEGKENAEVEKLRRTEELFRKALQNAGVNYAVDELTRVNSEKTHDSEENGGENAAEDALGENKKSPERGVRWSKKNKRLSDSDLNDYMRVGKTLHTRNKKQRMLDAGKNPVLTTETQIQNFILDAIHGNADGEVRAYGKVGDELASAIADIRPSLKTKESYLELNADNLREAYKKHSSPKEKGDISLTDEDFANIPRYLDEFDGITSIDTYKGKTEIYLYKKSDAGYYRILTVVSGERGSLQITKLIGVSKEKFEQKFAKKIERNTGSPRGQTVETDASNPSTKARHTAGALSNNSLHQNEPIVKRKIQESRKSANVNHDKAYTKSDARKVLSSVLSEQLVIGKEQIYGALYGKRYTETVNRLWKALNDAEPGARGGIALDIADYIIDNATAESMDLSDNAEAVERLQTLREYLHKLDLSAVSKRLADKYGVQWRVRKGEDGIALERAVAELRTKGIEINAEDADNLFLGIQEAYNEARSLAIKELKTKLGEVMTAEERKVWQQDIAKEILRGFDYTGEDSKLARETVRFEAERDALRESARERLEAEQQKMRELQEQIRSERRKLRERIEQWKAREELLDEMRKKAEKLDKAKRERFFSATVYGGDALKSIPSLLRQALTASRVRTGSIRNTLAKVQEWYCAEGNTMLYKATGDKHAEAMAADQVMYDPMVAALLDGLTSGTGELAIEELESVVYIADHFVKIAERYQRVFIDGHWVDAEKVAQKKAKIARDAHKYRPGFLSIVLNRYMRQFGDPAALCRAMDGYDPDGFFTTQIEAMRRAGIDMQVDELHALAEYYKWHESHKDWAKRLKTQTVGFRGDTMSLGEFLTLYCNSKTQKSKQALTDNGYKRVDEDGNPIRRRGFAYKQRVEDTKSRKNDYSVVQETCKAVEQEMWALLGEEERAYVQMLEKILNTDCRQWKIDTDTNLRGYTLVKKTGYYFPSAHAEIRKVVDTTFFEGDRVEHLSFNKSDVEGARGELYIENIDDVVLRHVHNMALYKNYAIVAENRSMLQNIDVGAPNGTGRTIKNVHQANTLKSIIGESGTGNGKLGTDMMKLLDKMSNDLQGGKRAGQDEQSFLADLVEKMRGNYARFQLGLNPKTLVTQLSSLIAAGNILEYNCIVRGIKGFASKKTAQLVDKYCPLAELRNFENSAAEASGLLEITGKHVGDFLMKGIGFVDRRVICGLFVACQHQIQKDNGYAIGTKENLEAAGKLLERVILETQQNSLVTEKSDAMRGNIFMRTFTMFSADSMKITGRWLDAVGEVSVIKRRLQKAETDAERAHWQKELKRAQRQAGKSTGALVGQAVYMALISYLFRLLYDRDEEDVAGNVKQGAWDVLGAVLGGLPIIRDMVSYFTDGYELNNFFLSTVNDVLVATKDAANVATDAISGKDVGKQDVASAVRKVVYSAGQLFGIPVRNAYNIVTGLTRRFIPAFGYVVDDLFIAKPYAKDLQKAIDAGDERMVGTIAGLMVGEKIHIEDDTTRATLEKLAGKGYSVLPRSVGDTVSVDGEELALSGKQQKKLREIYAIGEEAVSDMCKLKQFASADEAVQAKAIQFVYDVYWDLALEGATGRDLAEKNVLFAEAIPIEKLAVIIATVRAIEADKDKSGKAISGSKKRKVQTFVNSLQLTAAQKYMVMGYLGYSNINGEQAVRGYIGKLKLSKSEKAALLKYSGYAAN